MITTTTFPWLDSILCIAMYKDDGLIKKTKVAWATDVFKAENVLKRLQKEVLRDKISKFLNHRNQIMDHHGGIRTREKLQAYETLRTNFDFFTDKSLEANCNFIVNMKQKFESIMPGEKSMYYHSQRKMINEIYNYCEKQLLKTIK